MIYILENDLRYKRSTIQKKVWFCIFSSIFKPWFISFIWKLTHQPKIFLVKTKKFLQKAGTSFLPGRFLVKAWRFWFQSPSSIRYPFYTGMFFTYTTPFIPSFPWLALLNWAWHNSFVFSKLWQNRNFSLKSRKLTQCLIFWPNFSIYCLTYI